MKKLLYVSVLIFFCFAGQRIYGQDTNIEPRVSKLEGFVAKLPSISGFVNLRYQYEENANGFDIRRARLDFKGNLAKWMDYRLQVDFASSPKIIDAFIRFKINPMFNVQVGQFKYAFSLENPYSPLNVETIENSQVISYLSGYNDASGVKATGRDFGISFYGGFFQMDGYNLIDYTIGLYNGTGINAKDDNKHKDFTGRIDIHPIKAITLSGSYYNGKLGTDGSLQPRERWSAGIRYDDSKALLRSEYIKGKTFDFVSDGFYILAGYKFCDKIMPLFKYDYLQKDLSKEDSKQTNYVIGVDYWPYKNFRLQLNYTYRTFSDTAKNSGLLGLMFTARF